MPRILAIVLIVAYFFTAVPVWARRQTQAAEPAALDTGPTPNDACDLVNPFRGIHAVVIDLAEKAHDAGQYSLNLHRTSRWVGFKHVEVEVRDLEGVSKTTFRTIASLSFSLDTLPDNNAKQAAVTLASTYQNAVSQIDDYAHAAVDYERTENVSKLYMTTPLTYSIPTYWKTRTYWDNITRHHLDERYTEIGDALRSLEIPEHLYAKHCTPATFAAHVPATTTIENPCEVADRLADLRTTITRMGEKAVDAGHVSRALHLTSRWRPYKRVENDWIALTDKVNPTLDELANLALRINDSPDNNKKDVTLNLIANYQNAVEQFVDYTHFATYYERNQNEAGTNSYGFRLGGPTLGYTRDRAWGGLGLGGGVLGMPNAPLGSYEPDTRALLDFGTVRDNTKSNMVTSALNLFDAKYTEADDTFRSFKLPEYRFSKACRTTPPRISIPYAADPCRVSKDILGMRVSVTRLGEEVRDMDHTARGLHRTTRSRPLRYIEKKWTDVTTSSSPLLDELSDLLVALDAAPEGEKKKAAADLTTAYQSAVENFIDSGHLAVYYERAQNLLGARFYSDNGKVNFGIPTNVSRSANDLTARNYLESKILQANNASRSLKLPEYRYGKLCKIAIAPIKVREVGKR